MRKLRLVALALAFGAAAAFVPLHAGPSMSRVLKAPAAKDAFAVTALGIAIVTQPLVIPTGARRKS